jgi:hypothetical protein
MKKIPLTQGKFALVDDGDYEYLSQFKWYYHKGKTNRYGYARRTRTAVVRGESKRVSVLMHREICGYGVDHRDGDGINNQRYNLRKSTKSQNSRNTQKMVRKAGTSSKYKGVSKRAKSNKWRARISIRGKDTLIGEYLKEKQAALAYNREAKKHYGEYARLNEVR